MSRADDNPSLAPPEKGPADRWVSAALGLGFLALYVRTLCPTVYVGYSGEIAAAIVSGGAIHPPGYPVLGLLGRLALFLVPVGEPAFRIGCLLAATAAGAVTALYLLGRELRCRPWSAALGAVVFGLSVPVWSQAVRLDVHAPTALLAGIGLLGALAYRRSGCPGCLTAAVLSMSLGLAHRPEVLALAPALALAVVPKLRDHPHRPKHLALVAGALAVGPLLYALLPLWARSSPLHAWGNPLDLPSLWRHVTGAPIPAGPSGDRTAAALPALYAQSFPWGLALLPPVGAVALWRRNRPSAAVLLLGLIAALGVLLALRSGWPRYLAVWMIAAALLSVGADALLGLLRRPGGVRAAAGAALLAGAVGVLLARNWSACDLSRATWVRDLARHRLLSTDGNGVLVSQGDEETFPLWYVQRALGYRPDVIILDRARLRSAFWDYARDPSLWPLHHLRARGVDAPLDLPADRKERRELGADVYLLRLLQGPLRDRVRCVTRLQTRLPEAQDPVTFLAWAQARHHPLPQGMVVHLRPRSQAVDLPDLLARNERLWNEITLPRLEAVPNEPGAYREALTEVYAAMLLNFGGLYELAEQPERARQVYERILRWSPTDDPARQALAALTPVQ